MKLIHVLLILLALGIYILQSTHITPQTQPLYSVDQVVCVDGAKMHIVKLHTVRKVIHYYDLEYEEIRITMPETRIQLCATNFNAWMKDHKTKATTRERGIYD